MKFLAALGDLGAVRSGSREKANDPASVNDAFVHSCRFQHEAIALLVLDRSTTLDAELGRHVDAARDASAFVRYFIANTHDFVDVAETGLWRGFVMNGSDARCTTAT